MFDWNDLTFFLELARQGRLMPAARRLKVDHTTVSRRIAELERALDCKLFDRTPTGFVLSDAGQRLMAQAETVEATMTAIEEQVGNRPSAASGAVRIGTMEGIASMFLAGHVAAFHARYPEVQIELLTERHVANLPKREADVLLSFIKPTGPKLIVRKIGEFGLRLYGSDAYFARHPEPQTPEDLDHHLFIDYIEDIVLIKETHWLLDVIQAPSVVFRSSSMLAQQNAAASGLGLVLLPIFSARHDPRLRPVLPGVMPRRPIWLSVHEDLHYLSRVKAVTGFVREIVERSQDALLDAEVAA